MESTSLHAGHKLSIKALTDNNEAATGADVCLEIDGKVFNAVSIELNARIRSDDNSGSGIVEATVTFPISELTVDVSAHTKVVYTDAEQTEVRDITLYDVESHRLPPPLLLMGYFVGSKISKPKNDLADGSPVEDESLKNAVDNICIRAVAGQVVTAELECSVPVELL